MYFPHLESPSFCNEFFVFLQFLHSVSSDTKLNPNIKPFKWLPQNDLLGHRNTKAFISHLGSNGVNEAAYHGIPVIAAPFMTDGYDNYLRLATKGKMAKFIDVYGANSDTWLRTIEEVIYDPS